VKCREVQYKLAEKHSRSWGKEIRRHLEDCPECRDFYRGIKEIDSLSRELRGQYRAPDDMLGRVLDQYNASSSGGWFTLRSVVVSFFMAAAVLGVFLAWDQLGNSGELTNAVLKESSPVVTPETDPFPAEIPLAADADNDSYVEVVIDSVGDEELILRLPPVIEIHRTEIPDEKNHYQTVSY